MVVVSEALSLERSLRFLRSNCRYILEHAYLSSPWDYMEQHQSMHPLPFCFLRVFHASSVVLLRGQIQLRRAGAAAGRARRLLFLSLRSLPVNFWGNRRGLPGIFVNLEVGRRQCTLYSWYFHRNQNFLNEFMDFKHCKSLLPSTATCWCSYISSANAISHVQIA